MFGHEELMNKLVRTRGPEYKDSKILPGGGMIFQESVLF